MPPEIETTPRVGPSDTPLVPVVDSGNAPAEGQQTPSPETTQPSGPPEEASRLEKIERTLQHLVPRLEKATDPAEKQNLQEQVDRQTAQMETLLVRVDEDLSTEEKRTRIGAIETERRKKAESTRFQKHADALTLGAGQRLAKLGLTQDSPAVQEFSRRWAEARALPDKDRALSGLLELAGELNEYVDGERDRREQTAQTVAQREAAQKAEEERQERNRETGALAVDPGGGGSAASMSDLETWRAYGRGAPWTERVKEAGKNLGVL